MPELEDRLKERLTGAVILIVIVVILVPAMFRGEKPSVVVPAAAVPGSARVQSYTIDLAGGAAPAPTPLAVPAPLQPAPSAPSAPVSAPAPVAATVPAPAPEIASPPKHEPEPALKPATVPAPKPRAAPVDSGSGGYVVQVGSFSRRDNAMVMVKQAAHKGVRLAVAGPDDRGLFRVRSAVVHTHQEAMTLLSRLKSAGFNGMVSAAN